MNDSKSRPLGSEMSTRPNGSKEWMLEDGRLDCLDLSVGVNADGVTIIDMGNVVYGGEEYLQAKLHPEILDELIAELQACRDAGK